MTNKRKQGNDKEQMVAAYLRDNGFDVITTNFFCRYGEIDIIAREGRYLCFIEVKYRQGDRTGHPLEAVDSRKIKRISRTALTYLGVNGLGEDTPCRFDVVGVMGEEITLVRNAFEFVC